MTLRATTLPFATLLSATFATVALAGDWDPMPSKAPAEKDRFAAFHELAAKGPHMEVAVSTFFGGKDHEAFVAVGELPDGRVAAFGNAWGPSFPKTPNPVVIGTGGHKGLKPLQPVKKSEVLSDADPDSAGFVLIYEPGLKGIAGVRRFDWGVASLRTGKVTGDGKGLLLAGRCQPAFRAVKTKSLKTVASGAGGYTYEGVSCPGDVYILRMALDGTIEWTWVLEGAGSPPDELWQDKTGAVYFDVAGLGKISADGKAYRKVVDKTGAGTSGWHYVDADGNAYFGGDRNSHTNKEPWRQPFLYKYDPEGKKVWSLWEAPPKEVGHDAGGFESDSGIRDVAFLPNGNLIAAGWSDGANSVFQRLATNWKKNAPFLGFTDPWYPNGAQGFGHLMIVEPKTLETKGHFWWVSYLPASFETKANRTNNSTLASILPLPDGSIAWTGSAATGMIQTPNSFYKYPGTGKAGGTTMGVFKSDFSNLLFSSYMPGCSQLALGQSKNGVLVVGRCAPGADGAPPLPSYSVKALQSFGGGTDGILISLKAPTASPAQP